METKTTQTTKEDNKIRRQKIKVGRTCFSCKHAISRDGQFIKCRHTGKGKQPIWVHAHCPKWALTRVVKKLKNYMNQQEGIKHLVITRDQQKAGMKKASCGCSSDLLEAKLKKITKDKPGTNYIKNNDLKVADPVKLSLGRCCYLCKYRGAKTTGNRVECNRQQGILMWTHASCNGFKLFEDIQWIERISRYMRKSGVETKGTQWHKRDHYGPAPYTPEQKLKAKAEREKWKAYYAEIDAEGWNDVPFWERGTI